MESNGDESDRPGVTHFYSLNPIFELLGELVRRPSLYETSERDDPGWFARHRRGIPMLCLVREDGQGGVLRSLRDYLTTARPKRVPFAKYEFDAPEHTVVDRTLEHPSDRPEEVTRDDVSTVARVLNDIADQLSTEANSIDGRFRFWRFHLVYWLMTLEPGDKTRERILDALRGHDIYARLPRFLARLVKDAPGFWTRVMLNLIPPFWFRLRRSGSIPFIGREYYWLLKQPYLAPRDPGTVIGFAERIWANLYQAGGETESTPIDGGPVEDPEQLLYLLVNAFLEDLRRIYRRSFWRPLNSRCTTYPVVLIDNISRQNGGYLLFRALNETGDFDPVVFVSGSRRIPPLALSRDESDQLSIRPVAMNEAKYGYENWRRKFGDRSRSRERTTWYLPIKISEQWEAHHVDIPGLRKPRPPFWSRGAVLASVALLLVVFVVGLGRSWIADHCDYSPLTDYFATQEYHSGGNLDGQCTGVTDQGFPLNTQGADGLYHDPSVAQFSQVQNVIRGQNEEVTRLHADRPDRPYITLIYLTAISQDYSTLDAEKKASWGSRRANGSK